MSTSSERIEVFQDTLNWIENDIELSASVIYSKEHTKILQRTKAAGSRS